jgi:DNA-binding transcriptional MerR regulator
VKRNNSDKQHLYTSGEVMKILNISSSTLRSLVEKGLIEKVTWPGYKHGYYTKKSVNQYLEEKLLLDDMYPSTETKERNREQMITARKKTHSHLIKVKTVEEMAECLDLSQEIFGVAGGMEEERMKIVKVNPETYYLLKREKDPVGYLSIMPLKKGNLERILGQTLPVLIEPEQIETFERGKELDLYLTAIGIKPGLHIEEKREYGSILVRHMIRIIIGLGEKGVKIGKIAARSNMPDGIRLMKHVGFTEVRRATPERRTFVINVQESGVPFIEQYRKALEESKAITQE